jgi:hypothetical protein
MRTANQSSVIFFEPIDLGGRTKRGNGHLTGSQASLHNEDTVEVTQHKNLQSHRVFYACQRDPSTKCEH